MSRSFKHRNRDNTVNSYLKHVMAPSSFRPKNMNNEDYKDYVSNTLAYRIGKYEQSVPRSFRKDINKSKKSKDKTCLHHAIANDSFDNLVYPYWPKDAGYIYW
jgi:hypothetical protein